jgi:hypothetical protein
VEQLLNARVSLIGYSMKLSYFSTHLSIFSPKLCPTTWVKRVQLSPPHQGGEAARLRTIGSRAAERP